MRGVNILMQKISIARLLDVIGEYIILKRNCQFPDYSPGEDIDLLVRDRSDTIGRIYEYHINNSEPHFDLRVSESAHHAHAR